MAGTSARIRGGAVTTAAPVWRPRCARQAMAATPPATHAPASTISSMVMPEPDPCGAAVAVRAGATWVPVGCVCGVRG